MVEANYYMYPPNNLVIEMGVLYRFTGPRLLFKGCLYAEFMNIWLIYLTNCEYFFIFIMLMGLVTYSVVIHAMTS